MEAAEIPVEPGGEQPPEAPVENIQTQSQTPPPPADQGPPPWVEGLEKTFADQLGRVAGEIDQRIDQRLSPLEQALSHDPEPQEPYDPYYGYLQDEPPQVDQNAIMQQVEQLVEGRMAPLIEERREEMFDALMEEFPELATPEGAGPTAEAVREEAARLRQPELAEDPRFARLVHIALNGQPGTEAQEDGQQQRPDGAESPFQRFWREDRETPQHDLQQAIDERVQEHLTPIVRERREERFEALMEEFPELGTKEGAEPVAEAAQDAAARWGAPHLAGDPGFVRAIYLAIKGEERAAGETPAGDGSKAVLEQGGATPPEPEQDHFFQQLWAKGQAKRLNWD